MSAPARNRGDYSGGNRDYSVSRLFRYQRANTHERRPLRPTSPTPESAPFCPLTAGKLLVYALHPSRRIRPLDLPYPDRTAAI